MDFDQAKQTLLEELRRHALIIGEVTLTSGATAQYYVDAKRAILRPAGFAALGTLVAAYAARVGGHGRRRPHDGCGRAGVRGTCGRGGRQGLLRAQGDQGARAAARDRGAAAGAGRALPHRRGRGDLGRLDGAGDRGRPRPRATTSAASSRSSTAGGRRGRDQAAAGGRRTPRWRRSTRCIPTAPTAVPPEALGNTGVTERRWWQPLQDAPSRSRTCGLLLRRESLYPSELSGPMSRNRSPAHRR